MTRAPLRLAIRNAASETPPPMPQTSTVSPGRTCARVTTMRQAVRVTSENAAASVHVSGFGSVGIKAVFCSGTRSEEHTSELQSLAYLVCRLLLEKKKETK